MSYVCYQSIYGELDNGNIMESEKELSEIGLEVMGGGGGKVGGGL